MKGLTNVGNTCYLNAAVQCLAHAPGLTNYVLAGWLVQDASKRRPNAHGVAVEYAALVTKYWSTPEAVLDTQALWAAACKAHKPFATREPHDAHEALLVLLRCLHDALTRTPRIEGGVPADAVDADAWEAHLKAEGYSVVSELFVGQTAVEVAEPRAGGYASRTYEHFRALTLDLGGCASVSQALARAFEPVQVDDVDLGGRRGPAVLSRRLVYCPAVLVLHLKRFEADGSKVDRFVDYSTHLDVPGHGAYDLFAVCVHGGAHYVAVCEAGGRWHAMDDAAVGEVPVNAVVQKDAYVLLYKRR